MLTHTNLTGQTMTALYTHGVDLNNDVGFIGVPLFHIAGLGNMLTPMLLGIPTVIHPLGAFDPDSCSMCWRRKKSPASSWCPHSGRRCAPNSRPIRVSFGCG
ncbi:acyl-CoA synthetase domain protein [Mycobacterium xenopi 4042]|uniref:Acyl-CoA synthetase domain protein n=1 Tax=Mycobacterium xenopi 4042 TaxID=1299334 RepID=X8BIQ1_MYCXE|nr:acyl-CoA synthetase domain protein [Mycobacterium xenopi 4042]